MKSRSFSIGGTTYSVAALDDGVDDGDVRVEGPGAPPIPLRVRRLDATTFEVTDANHRWRRIVYLVTEDDRHWAFSQGCVFDIRPADRSADRSDDRPPPGTASSLESPMPASVVDVLVSPGQVVRRGDLLVLLEAMKMELPIRAPADGVVASVRCRRGELVQPGVGLVELEPEDPTE